MGVKGSIQIKRNQLANLKIIHYITVVLMVPLFLYIGYSNFFVEAGRSHQPEPQVEGDIILPDSSIQGTPEYRYPQTKNIYTEPKEDNFDKFLKVVQTITPLAVPFITHHLYKRKERIEVEENDET